MKSWWTIINWNWQSSYTKTGISSTVPAGILETDYLTSCLNSFLAILTCLPNQPVSLTSYFLPLSKHFEFLTSKTCSFVFYFDCDLCVVFLSVSMLIPLHVNIWMCVHMCLYVHLGVQISENINFWVHYFSLCKEGICIFSIKVLTLVNPLVFLN